jgi:hypothetical protein
MARCYFLCASRGSSLDQHSNNVSLFNLVEQITVPPGMAAARGGVIPIEVHAYFQLGADELNRQFELRMVLHAETGLETLSDPLRHRSQTPRLRVRIMGMPFPPVPGAYTLSIDFRLVGEDSGVWQRQSVGWPITLVESDPRPRVTH